MWFLPVSLVLTSTIALIRTQDVPWPIVVPVDQLREARQIPGSSQLFITDLPSWVNLTLLEIGQRYFRENFFGFMYSTALNGFLIGSGADSVRVAISTGKSTRQLKSMKRYLVNSLHLGYWATTNLKTDKESFLEILNLLHSLHAKIGASAHMHKELYAKPLIPEPTPGENPYKIEDKLWDAFHRDLLASRLREYGRKPVFPPKDGGTEYYLNQFAMSMQLWSMARGIVKPESVMFYNVTDENLWGFLHFWALIGRGMGIEDTYNVCLQPDLASAKVYLAGVLEEYYLPGLFHLDYEYKVAVEAGVKGIGDLFPMIDFGVAFLRICTDMLEIECPNVKRALSAKGNFYNFGLNAVVKPTIHLDITQRIARFVMNSMLQVPAIRMLHFNPIFHSNFTAGLIEHDEKLVAISDVCFNGTHWDCKHDKNEV